MLLLKRNLVCCRWVLVLTELIVSSLRVAMIIEVTAFLQPFSVRFNQALLAQETNVISLNCQRDLQYRRKGSKKSGEGWRILKRKRKLELSLCHMGPVCQTMYGPRVSGNTNWWVLFYKVGDFEIREWCNSGTFLWCTFYLIKYDIVLSFIAAIRDRNQFGSQSSFSNLFSTDV